MTTGRCRTAAPLLGRAGGPLALQQPVVEDVAAHRGELLGAVDVQRPTQASFDARRKGNAQRDGVLGRLLLVISGLCP